MGDPLVAVEPSEVREEDGELVVYLDAARHAPDQRCSRVVFGAENTFAGEVFDTQSASLPQQVEAGDASTRSAPNNLRVLGGSEETGDIIQNLSFASSAVTPWRRHK